MNKLSRVFYVGMICWIPMSSAIGFSDDINYTTLYDAAKVAYPRQEALMRDEAVLKSKAGRFSEVLAFIRENIPNRKNCFISHAFHPGALSPESQRFDYYDQFYRFLGVSLRLVGFDVLCDLFTDDPRVGIRGNDETGDFCRRAGDVDYAIPVFVSHYKVRYADVNSGVRIEFDCIGERHARERLNLHYYAPLLLDGDAASSIPETRLRGRIYQQFGVREGNRFFYDDFFELLRTYLMIDHQAIIHQATQLFDNPNMPLPGQRRGTPDLEDPVIRLQRGLDECTQKIQAINAYIRNFPNTNEFIFIVGLSGSGKTVLAHLLARKNLRIEHIQDSGFCLVPQTAEDYLPGFNIGHGIPAGTPFPSIWHDEVRRAFLIDCTGLGDPAGPVTDILNAFSIKQLFQGRKAKVILTLKESMLTERDNFQNLKRLLGDLVGFFRNDAALQESLSLVVTRRETINLGELELGSEAPGQSISSFITRRTLPLFVDDGYLPHRYERSRSLLRFFSAHPNRVSSLRKAEQLEGPFICEAEKRALNYILGNSYFVPLSVTLEIGQTARDFVGRGVDNLNGDLVRYLSTIGRQRITNHCHALIAEHNASIRDLRATFSAHSERLRNLSRITPENPREFPNRMGIFMNTDDIQRRVEQLSFLRTLNGDIDIRRIFKTMEWAQVFDEISWQIASLSTHPGPHYDARTQIIYIKSVLLGTSEIQEASRQNPRASSVYAYAFNTIFFDSPITNHGKSLVLISPLWKASASRLIDLSGIKGRNGDSGAPGMDGAPGSPGQSGGHFYGLWNTFEDARHLEINTSGGQGGDGGNGGKGADGVNGVDGDLTRCASSPLERPNLDTGWKHGPNWRVFSGISDFYNEQGTDGKFGHNGGRGGRKGYGGILGRVSSFLPLAHRSEMGSDGQHDGAPGEAGRGGQHGRHCTGQIDRNITYRNMRKDEDRDNKIRDMGPGSEPDCVISAPRYLERDPKSAPDGQPGSRLSGVEAMRPARSAGLNVEAIRRDYREAYEIARRDANIAPFIEPFQGLDL